MGSKDEAPSGTLVVIWHVTGAGENAILKRSRFHPREGSTEWVAVSRRGRKRRKEAMLQGDYSVVFNLGVWNAPQGRPCFMGWKGEISSKGSLPRCDVTVRGSGIWLQQPPQRYSLAISASSLLIIVVIRCQRSLTIPVASCTGLSASECGCYGHPSFLACRAVIGGVVGDVFGM